MFRLSRKVIGSHMWWCRADSRETKRPLMKRRARVAIMAAVVLAASLHQSWQEPSARKSLYARWESRSNELERWVDRKVQSGAINTPNGEIGSFLYVGGYDIDIDFDPARYGLDGSAAARVVLDRGRSHVSVVFMDNSGCAIAVAVAQNDDIARRFGHMASDLSVISPRIATFCVERD